MSGKKRNVNRDILIKGYKKHTNYPLDNSKNSMTGNRIFVNNNRFFTSYVIPCTRKAQVLWVLYFVLLTLVLPVELLYEVPFYKDVIATLRDHLPIMKNLELYSPEPVRTLSLVPILYAEIVLGLSLCAFHAIRENGFIGGQVEKRIKIRLLITCCILLIPIIIVLFLSNAFPSTDTGKGRYVIDMLTVPSYSVFAFWLISHTAISLQYILIVAFKSLFKTEKATLESYRG